jgi:hypothetical protein
MTNKIDPKALSQIQYKFFIITSFLGEKLNDKLPITYDYYHNVIKGKTQQNAPTFQTKTIS